MKSGRVPRLFEGGASDDIVIGTRKSDVLDGGAGDDVIIGGRGHDLLTGGDGADTFTFGRSDTGDATLGQADVITDFGSDDTIDLSDAGILFFNGFDWPEPLRSGLSIWQAGGDTFVSWKTGGDYHDIVLADFDGDAYQLLGQIVWFEDDYAGGTSTSGHLTLGETVTGEIQDASDQDWFRIELDTGQLYTFDLQGSADGGGTLGDPWLTLYDEDGNFVVEGYDTLQYAAETPGTYYVAALGYGSLGSYSLTVGSEAYEDDFGNGPDTAGPIAAGDVVTGEIGIPTDEDWMRLDVEAGQSYTFTVAGSGDGGGTLAAPYLVLYDADGNYLGETSQGIDYVPDEDATVYAVVNGSGETGTYTLSVTTEPYVDDYGADPTTAGAIAAGETVAGRVGTPNDEDWFAVSFTAGESYRINLRGADSGAGTLYDPYLLIYDEAGSVIAEDDDGGYGLDSLIAYDAAEDGTYYIGARALSGPGTYQLSVDLLAT